MAFLYDIMGNNLVKSAAVDFGIQWVLWVVASKLQTEKFYDLAGMFISQGVHIYLLSY